MEHNRRLLDEVQHLRDKARRSDMLADELALWNFFDSRLPEDVFSGKTFETWRRQAEARDRSILELSRADILLDEAAELSPARYPDELTVRGAAMRLTYKFEPGEDDDGITATVPLALLPQLDPAVLSWTIPGWHEDKLRALLESLPKPLRKALAPVEDLVRELATTLRPFDGAMLPVLERVIFERTGQRVPRDAWDLRAVPAHLSMGFRVVDDNDRTIAQGRDLGELQRTLGNRAKELWSRAPRERHERTGMKAWDIDTLPSSVTLEVGGRAMLAYPALVETEMAVDLRLLESAAAAAASTRDGLRRLFLFQMSSTLAKQEAPLPALLGPARRQIVLRALDEAFQLTDPETFPRTKAEFTARAAAGRVALPDILGNLVRTAIELSEQHDKVRAALKPLAGRPGPTRTAVEDIQSQLRRLVQPDLMRETPFGRLVHISRYLKAIHIRLQRLSHDPLKDQQKAAQVAPFWASYVKKRDETDAKGFVVPELEELGWLLEEFRVQTFAPELKTAVPVSVQRLQEFWSRLAR